MARTPVKTPGGFAPAIAIGQSDESGNLTLVDAGNPLPVRLSEATGPAPDALTGQTGASGRAGPFIPRAGRAVYLQLSGTWEGRVDVVRSVDEGASVAPLTIAGSPWAQFTANACEAVWEENEAGAQLYLEIDLVSGTLDYRVSQ